MIQGLAGAMSITGERDGMPMKAGYATADIFTGMYTTVAILAALRQRDATGEGATIDCALFEAQTAVLGNQAMNYLVGGTAPGRMGNAHPNIVPYAVYPCADGHFILASGNDRQFRDAMAAIGAPELAADPRFATNADRIRLRGELTALIDAKTRLLPKAEALARLEALKVPAGPINAIDEVLADPQAVARGLRVDLPADWAKGGSIPTVRGPLVMDGVPLVADRPSPRLGADQRDVLDDPAWGGGG
jgi:crotonobetainyl-CoA:carnitine CoA-transferase CaiB-like acyl-CoA transferase